MLPIQAFSIENFKSFGPKQTFPFSRVNFIFGPNSQGKSAALQALALLMNGYLKNKTDINVLKHLDNSPDVEIGYRNINNTTDQNFYTLESHSTYHIPPVLNLNELDGLDSIELRKRFTVKENDSRELVKFQLIEIISDEEVPILTMDSEFVELNPNSIYLRAAAETTISDFPESWTSTVRVDDIHIDLNELRVDRNIRRTESGSLSLKDILSNEGQLEVSVINDIIQSLFIVWVDEEKKRNPEQNPLDWIGPNRFVSDKSCTINGEKGFIEDSFLNNKAVNEMNEWLRKTEFINIGYDLIVNEPDNSEADASYRLKEFGVKKYGEEAFLKMSQVGSGITHAFQMILPFFNNIELLIIQQPEIHLHPSLQVQLSKALIALSEEKGVQLIIETHSEHFIKAAQLEIVKGLSQYMPTLFAEDLNVLYISKNEDGFSTVKRIKVDETGSFTEPWPDDFFDLSADLSLERLRQSYKSRN